MTFYFTPSSLSINTLISLVKCPEVTISDDSVALGHYFIYLWQLSWISCGLCVSNPWIYRFCHCFPLRFNIIPLHIPYKNCISSRYFKRTLDSVLTRYHNLHKQNTCLFRTEKLVPRNFISKRSQKCCLFGRHT
jgi:hypothetical protein